MAASGRRPLRVIQWGTGNVGRRALRGIIAHPGLELVGVHAHGAAKVGCDAADLCGLGSPTGIVATDDVDQLLALDADCVCYMAIGETRVYDALDDWLRIVRSGKNVANTAVVSMVYPPFASRKLTGPLRAACEDNGVSFYTSGFDPGFTGDLIPLILAAGSERVDSVRVAEVMDYSTYADPNFTGEFFGFGKPLDFKAPMFYPGAIKAGWGSVIELVADALGFELDEIVEESERIPAHEAFDTDMGRVERGTCAAVRFEVRGVSDGRVVVISSHTQRLRTDVAPDWERLAGDKSGYRIEVRGSPDFNCEIDLKGDDGDHNTGIVTGTAMRVVNAIPTVCAAAPGVLSIRDLPLYTARVGVSRTPG
ncbi:MAG: diacylglycerol kinase [Myxococcota bacterium]